MVEAIGYGYDANGRRVTETKSAASLADTAFTAQYDAADRMTGITLTASGQTFTLAYDDNGNLVSKTETTNPSNQTLYSWDRRNRLTGIQGPGVNAAFSYDALGRRVAKTVNGQTLSYVYDGLQAVGEIGPSGAVGLLTGLGLDEVIARYTNAGARTYLTDALNTVLAQTRGDQSIQNFYAYSPYGEASTLGDDEGNAIQYTARENDNTSLYFYRARYYDPVLKRFISEDPIGMTAGPNFYRFVNNNPVSFTDPLGLVCMYAQSTGRLVCFDPTTGHPYVDTPGYSGSGLGRNNPNMQDVPYVGPIPQGCWVVGAPTGRRGTGPYSLPLTPLPDNDVFSTPRDPNSFLLHGPNTRRPNDSSTGCPIIDWPSRQAIPAGEVICVTP